MKTQQIEYAANAEKSSASSPYRWVILCVAFGVQIFCSLSLYSLSPLGPYIREGLSISNTQFGLLFTASNLGTMVMLTFTGLLVDRRGVRSIMLIGQVIMGLLVVAASAVGHFLPLVVLLFFTGICQSIAGPTGATSIVTWFSPKERATAMGIKQAGIPAAGIVAGLVLPAIAAFSSWRAALCVAGVSIVVSGVLSFLLYRDSDMMKQKRESAKAAPASTQSTRSILTRDIVLLSVGCGILMGVQFSFTSYLTGYLSELFTAMAVVSPLVLAGTYYSWTSTGGFIGRVGLGMISDRIFHGRRKGTLLAVCLIGTLILFLMAFCAPHIGILGVGLLVFVYGLTGVSFTGIQLSLVSEIAGVNASGSATGFTLSLGFAGMMAFPPLFGAIIDATHDYFWGWLTLAALSLVGVLFILPVRDPLSK